VWDAGSRKKGNPQRARTRGETNTKNKNKNKIIISKNNKQK
jgi:hypothetical protein